MVDKLMHNSLSTSLSVDLLLVFVIFNVENGDPHMYEVENGNKIFNALLLISGYSFCNEIQN